MLLLWKLAPIIFIAQPQPSMPQQGVATWIGRASLGAFGKNCAQSLGSGILGSMLEPKNMKQKILTPYGSEIN